MRLSFILTRVAARTGVALWRHRIAVLVATLGIAGASLFQLSYAGPSATTGDCADMTMAVVSKVDDEVARAAYACLGPNMRNTSEDAFVAGMHERAVPNGQINRVGDQRTRDGGRIVFFTVEQHGRAVGYIVYLDPAGKVIRVE
jgi:hypothetical protein